MPATITALPAAQLTWRNAPAPCFITCNLLESAGQATYPKANTTGLFTGADGSHASYPITSLYDRNRMSIWRWAAATGSTVYILHDAGAGETFTADCIAWEGVYDTDWLSAVKSPTLVVQASDAVDGGHAMIAPTTITTIAGPFTQDWHVELWSSSYAARYWSVSMDWAGAETGWFQFSQLWLGRQRQFPTPPDGEPSGHDPLEEMSDWRETETAGGFVQRVGTYADRRRIRGRWWLRAAEAQTHIRTMYDETAGWVDPLWMIREPDTTPTEALFGHFQDPGLYLPDRLGFNAPADVWFDADFRELLPRGAAAGP